MVTGISKEIVDQFEDRLIDSFSESVLPPTHTCVLFALLDLDRHLQNRRSNAKLKSMFEVAPTDTLLDNLMSFCQTNPLSEFRTPEWNQVHESFFALQVPNLDVRITLAQYGKYDWKLVSAK